MKKDQLIQLLKEYKQNKASLNIKIKKLKQIKIILQTRNDIDTITTNLYGPNQNIHSKNKISDKVLNKIEENDTRRLKLKEKVKNLEKEVKELKKKIEAVDDRLVGLKYKERELLVAYYIDGRTAENISRTLYYDMYQRTCTPRYIQKIIEKATSEMLII